MFILTSVEKPSGTIGFERKLSSDQDSTPGKQNFCFSCGARNEHRKRNRTDLSCTESEVENCTSRSGFLFLRIGNAIARLRSRSLFILSQWS